MACAGRVSQIFCDQAAGEARRAKDHNVILAVGRPGIGLHRALICINRGPRKGGATIKRRTVCKSERPGFWSGPAAIMAVRVDVRERSSRALPSVVACASFPLMMRIHGSALLAALALTLALPGASQTGGSASQ